MESILEILKYTLPSLVVFFAAYFLLKQLFDNQIRSKELELERERANKSLPIRLQAYERLVLLMERLSPTSILTRYSAGEMTVPEFHLILINEIKQEFQHNITQQMYVSNTSWTMVKAGVDELIGLINNCASALPNDASGQELSKSILNQYIASDKVFPTERAILVLREEVAKYL